jgi:hypothetical protein
LRGGQTLSSDGGEEFGFKNAQMEEDATQDEGRSGERRSRGEERRVEDGFKDETKEGCDEARSGRAGEESRNTQTRDDEEEEAPSPHHSLQGDHQWGERQQGPEYLLRAHEEEERRVIIIPRGSLGEQLPIETWRCIQGWRRTLGAAVQFRKCIAIGGDIRS